ncbi:MAG: AmpG family muropeptide MFS transporter [Alphaproteobacteria bacterium]|nr:MAG: AmpG family muropeptide MFS transporter [Alphaproteobacteria bacterium]
MTEAGGTELEQKTFLEALKAYRQPKMAMMLVLGFAAGLPFLLYFATLSVRLEKSGIDVTLIAFFSWFGLSYSFKFLWAPLVDRFDPPGLASVFGRRRAWIFVAQIGVALGLIGLGIADPTKSLAATALFSFLVAFSSATQDIGVDAWRIEAAANEDEQAPLAAAYQYGYKVGMLVSGGIALMLADYVGWAGSYFAMAVFLALAAIIFALWDQKQGLLLSARGILSGLVFALILFTVVVLGAVAIGKGVPAFLAALGVEFTRGEIGKMAAWLAALPIILCLLIIPFIRRIPSHGSLLQNPSLGPFLDFFWRHGWHAVLILLFVSTYRLSDIVMGIMAKPAYSGMGYGAFDIGLVSGTYGPWMVFVGVALGGLVSLKMGLTRTLVIGAIISVLGNLTFAWLVNQSSETTFPLFVAVTADNIAGGFAGTVFVAYLSTLVNRSFAGTQYAIFSSIYTLGPKLLAGSSGLVVAAQGYTFFFLYAAALGLPAILLSAFVERMKPDRESVFFG